MSSVDGRGRPSYLLPLVSGVAMIFAYPPFSVPLLPFVGLVPLFLFLNRPLGTKELCIGGWAFAFPYFVGSIYWLFWLARFTPAGVLGAVGTLAMHWATFLIFPLGVNLLQHSLRLPLPLTAPFLWTLGEHARTYGDFYFPWVTLGYSLSDWPLLIQHADLIGVYGISWWLALINSLVVMLVVGGGWRPRVANAAALAAVLALPMIYNAIRWTSVERGLAEAATVDIAVIQPDIHQKLKWDRKCREENLARINRIIAEAERGAPDLVVGPEASLPMILEAGAARLGDEIESGDRPLLLGIVRGFGETYQVTDGGRTGYRYRRHLNSAVLTGPDRTIVDAHDKQYLVPITEQIPYKSVFGFFLPFMRNQFGRFVPGEELRVLTLPDATRQIRFGVLVCYESLFPGLPRRLVEREAGFLVNITNDAWFGRTSMPFQHLGFSVLRAIETRRSVVRSANTGVSAFLDPLGRVTERSGLFEEAILEGAVPLGGGLTFYARWGDELVYFSYLVTGLLLLAGWRRYVRGSAR